MLDLPGTPFEQGFNANKRNKNIHYNPYRNREGKGQEFGEWVKGWEAAAAEKQKSS